MREKMDINDNVVDQMDNNETNKKLGEAEINNQVLKKYTLEQIHLRLKYEKQKLNMKLW